jgi:hypothetical protein
MNARASLPLALLFASALAARLHAQDIPLEAETAPLPTPAETAAKPSGTPGEKTPPPPPPASVIAQKNFLAPASVLQELRAESANTSPEAKRTSRILSAALTADWKDLAVALKEIPDHKQAADAYSALLEKFAQSTKFPAFNPAFQNMHYGEAPPERQDQTRQHLLVSTDFSLLLAAAPETLTSKDVAHLAKIGAVALNEADRSHLANQFETGLGQLGGKNPDARAHAASILSALGEPDRAKPFLPTDADPNTAAVSLQQLLALIQYHAGLLERGATDASPAKAAATCTALAKRIPSEDAATRTQLAERLPALLNAMKKDDALAFIRKEIIPHKPLLDSYSEHLLTNGNTSLKSVDERTRTASITAISRFLNAFASTNTPLPSSATGLALLWIDEAECSLRYLPDRKENEDGRRRIGRMYGFFDSGAQSRFSAIARKTVLDLAPDTAVIDPANPALAQRIRQIRIQLQIGDPSASTLSELKPFLDKHPELRSHLVSRYLEGWMLQRTQPEESEEIKQMRANGFFIPKTAGLPVTRARQIQNLKEFGELLPTLRDLSGNTLKPELEVRAFAALHSPAEVFLAEDIERIFGKPETLKLETVAQLAQVLRKNLASLWDDPSVQQQQGTNRTKSETENQVRRGYATAVDLVKRSLAANEGDWQSLRTCALTLFDAAEFEFKKKGPLETYLAGRKEALALFQRSAEAYNKTAPALPESKWTIDPYLPWISAMLGATDLARLKWAEGRPEPAYAPIATTLNALPPEVAAHHRSLLAKLAESALPNIQPAMRRKILAAIDQIVGPECKEAATLRRTLESYTQLTAESRLVLKIDGPAEVAADTPFGAMLFLDYTSQLGRESGNFTKYLLNPGSSAANSPFMSMMMGGQKPPNYRDDLLKNIRTALQNTFEISASVFHSESVTPMAGHTDGWLRTPLAYLVLKPKNAAVDVIPPIQIDLEFAEASQQVILPVTSQAEPLRIHPNSGPRPNEDLSLSITVDEREWTSKQRLLIEIDAKAKGLIGDLNTLINGDFKDFEAKTTDTGNNLDEFKTEENRAWAQTSRSWQIALSPKSGRNPARLLPPALRPDVTAKIEYRSYRDADLVTHPESITKSGIPLTGSSAGSWLRTLFAMALVGTGVFALRNRIRKSAPKTDSPALPSEITLISTLRFLNRCAKSGKVPEALSETLTVDIHRLEAQCFAPNGQAAPPSIEQLTTLLHRYRSFAS